MPLSLLAAMGSGLVPVASDLPVGVPEVVDETTGKVIAVDNIAGYAGAIVWLHRHRREVQQLSRSAREKVRREYGDWQSIVWSLKSKVGGQGWVSNDE